MVWYGMVWYVCVDGWMDGWMDECFFCFCETLSESHSASHFLGEVLAATAAIWTVQAAKYWSSICSCGAATGGSQAFRKRTVQRYSGMWSK